MDRWARAVEPKGSFDRVPAFLRAFDGCVLGGPKQAPTRKGGQGDPADRLAAHACGRRSARACDRRSARQKGPWPVGVAQDAPGTNGKVRRNSVGRFGRIAGRVERRENEPAGPCGCPTVQKWMKKRIRCGMASKNTEDRGPVNASVLRVGKGIGSEITIWLL